MIIKKKLPLKLTIIKYCIQNPIEFLNRKFSRVGYGAFHDLLQFSWVKSLEDAANDIQQECIAVSTPKALPNVQHIFPAESPLASNENWKVYFLYLYWNLIEEQANMCPATINVIKKIPGVVSVFFSVLSPGKTIPEHVGGYNGVLRCHLGLVIPSPEKSCGISVGGKTEYWSAKKVIIFDDTFPHSAWNHSNDQHRIVLFIDFLRPLPPVLSQLNKWFYQFVSKQKDIQEGLTNLKNLNLTLTNATFEAKN